MVNYYCLANLFDSLVLFQISNPCDTTVHCLESDALKGNPMTSLRMECTTPCPGDWKTLSVKNVYIYAN